jgi:hypothetical protein
MQGGGHSPVCRGLRQHHRCRARVPPNWTNRWPCKIVSLDLQVLNGIGALGEAAVECQDGCLALLRELHLHIHFMAQQKRLEGLACLCKARLRIQSNSPCQRILNLPMACRRCCRAGQGGTLTRSFWLRCPAMAWRTSSGSCARQALQADDGLSSDMYSQL